LTLERLEDRCLLSYTITDVGTFDGSSFSTATGLNATGQVVGYDFTSDHQGAQAYLFDSGNLTDLGNLGGNHAFAQGINDLGQVAGYSRLADDATSHAFLYDSGTLTDLGPNGGNGFAYAINNNGDVAGYANINGGPYHAVLWQGATMTFLPDLGGSISYGQAIDAAGDVVGLSYLPGDAVFHGFLVSQGQVSDLGTFAGAANSWANGVNNVGQVVGFSGNSPNDYHAFLWDAVNGMQDLGTLGGVRSYANAINDAGQVVGFAALPSGVQHAFLYDGGVMTDLNDLLPPGSGWEVYQAYGINASGQIVGEGFHNGAQHGFLMTPDTGPHISQGPRSSSPILPGYELAAAGALSETRMVVGLPFDVAEQSRAGEFQQPGTVFEVGPTRQTASTSTAWTVSGERPASEHAGASEGTGDWQGTDHPDDLVGRLS
jgi:probable HAF family extracellular repeat protein